MPGSTLSGIRRFATSAPACQAAAQAFFQLTIGCSLLFRCPSAPWASIRCSVNEQAELQQASHYVGEWMHHHGCTQLLCEIESAWQAGVAQGLPTSYLQGSHYCEAGLYSV
jgi:hypothetical protein